MIGRSTVGSGDATVAGFAFAGHLGLEPAEFCAWPLLAALPIVLQKGLDEPKRMISSG
jgi:fructose-1-phosphate kinase PfkB-like protein